MIMAVSMPTHFQFKPLSKPCFFLNQKTKKIYSLKLKNSSSRSSSFSASFNQTFGRQLRPKCDCRKDGEETSKSKKRVFFLDVNPLCYTGSTPSLHSFGQWVSLFFSQVSLHDPVIGVLDGERGNDHRRMLLPSYKAHRKKFLRWPAASGRSSRGARRSQQVIINVLNNCNVPVVQIEGHEADDVVATLVEQVVQRGYRVIIASPDKDFKQLISEDVQMVMPLPELGRWSFYTCKHYIAQYNCNPHSDLSLRCLLGDEVDGVPGIQHLVPGFGQKTAIKLLKKHGSLENLLNAAAVRTVGRQYVQEALTKHAGHLRRNYEVLALRRLSISFLSLSVYVCIFSSFTCTQGWTYSNGEIFCSSFIEPSALVMLKCQSFHLYKVLDEPVLKLLYRDVDVCIQDDWLVDRDTSNDSIILSKFLESLKEIRKGSDPNISNFSNG